MVLWFVRVVLAGKGSNLYDIVLWNHVCIGRKTTDWLSEGNTTSMQMAT